MCYRHIDTIKSQYYLSFYSWAHKGRKGLNSEPEQFVLETVEPGLWAAWLQSLHLLTPDSTACHSAGQPLLPSTDTVWSRLACLAFPWVHLGEPFPSWKANLCSDVFQKCHQNSSYSFGAYALWHSPHIISAVVHLFYSSCILWHIEDNWPIFFLIFTIFLWNADHLHETKLFSSLVICLTSQMSCVGLGFQSHLISKLTVFSLHHNSLHTEKPCAWLHPH